MSEPTGFVPDDPMPSARPGGGRRVADLAGPEIVALFAWYGFRDSHGHAIEHCRDFTDLVDRAVADRVPPEPLAMK